MIVDCEDSVNIDYPSDASGRSNQGERTFIGKLVKAPEGIYAIVTAIRHRGINQTRRNMALGLLDAGTIVRTRHATASRTGR